MVETIGDPSLQAEESLRTSEAVVVDMFWNDPELFYRKLQEGKIDMQGKMIDPTFTTCWAIMLQARKRRQQVSDIQIEALRDIYSLAQGLHDLTP